MRHFSASKTALCLARPARYFSGCPRIFSQAPKVSSKSRRSQQSSANERFNYNSNPFDHSDISDPHLSHYPLLTASQLSAFSSPPKRVRLLTRDFIDDALYNPNYGYFNQQAVIFDPDEAVQKQDIGNQQQLPQQGFKFNEIRNSSAFDREVLRRYGVLEGEQSSVALPGRDASSARQVWHTPTELFKVRHHPSGNFCSPNG